MSIVLLAVVILILSLLGGLAPRAFADRLSGSQLEMLTGLASGLLLASAVLVVIPEGFHTAAAAAVDDTFVFEPAVLGLAVLAGFVAMLLLEGFGVGHAVHEEHHDHATGHGHGHVHHPTSTSVLALGLTAHAVADGIAIGSAAVAGDAAFSILVGIAVLIHRVPAAFSLGLFTLHEIEDSPAAFRGLLAFSLATPLTILTSYLVLDEADERAVALALLFSAGTFVYVATVDTLPAIHNPDTGRASVRNVLIGVGLFTIFLFGADWAGLLDHAH
ncbi:MAG: zinc transporter 9 [Verrucomicrobiales bacterium]